MRCEESKCPNIFTATPILYLKNTGLTSKRYFLYSCFFYLKKILMFLRDAVNALQCQGKSSWKNIDFFQQSVLLG
jgi:hypothetical protein